MLKKWMYIHLIVFLVVMPVWGIQTPEQGTTPTAPGPARMPPVYYDSLLNGLQLMIVERPGEPEVTIGLMIKKGAAFDLADREGSADLLARLVLLGSQTVHERPLADLFRDLDVRAEAAVTWDMTRFVFQVPNRNLLVLLPVLAEILTRSTFSEVDVAAMKRERLTLMNQTLRSPTHLADTEFMGQLFNRHPYGRAVEGTMQSVEAITGSDLSRVHRRFYLANDAVLTVVGDVTAESLMSAIRPTFGALRKGRVIPSTFTIPLSPSGVQIRLLDQPEAREAVIRMGYRTSSQGSDDHVPLLLLNEALGPVWSQLGAGFSEGSVTVNGHISTRVLMGSFTVSATAPPQLVPTVIRHILEAIGVIRRTGVDLSDLETARTGLLKNTGEFSLGSRELVHQLQDIELYDLGRDAIVTRNQRIQQVTSEDVKRVAAQTFSTSDVFVVVVGPAAEMVEGLQGLGKTEVIRN